jgi:hypothetical protein
LISLRRSTLSPTREMVILREALMIYTFLCGISRMTALNEALDDLRLFLSSLKAAI